MGRGRPTLEALLERVDEEVRLFRADYGSLPRAVEADEILREIWVEDTYHSTSLEGNPLSKREVERLLTEGVASGNLTDSLEVEGYARAARWVYAHAQDFPIGGGVSIGIVRQTHEMLITPAWAVAPPDDGSRPGGYRQRGARIAGSRVKTTPVVAIEGIMTDWVEGTQAGPEPDTHQIVHVADMHAWFERIHPFADGNGRVGRLLMNFMLVQRGYPPAVFSSTEREKYLDALDRADAGSPRSLAELIARAIEASLNKFLIPQLAGDARLVPLAALSEGSQYSADYLRTLAVSGRLRAVRHGKIWLSSRTWLKQYRESRSTRGRRPAHDATDGVI
jgi:Fic family protein